MKYLKRLVASVVLLLAFGLTAFAECPAPGQMDTPSPCTVAQPVPDDSIAPGQMDTTATVSEATLVELPSLVEIALNILTLY